MIKPLTVLRNASPFALLALAVCLAAVVPPLFMDGMFMDGEMYTAVSHNLARGIGTPWMPYYTDDFLGLDSFHENPPLATWLLALFFYALGSSIYVERLYILCTFLAIAILFAKTYRLFLPKEARYWWLSFFLFVSLPVAHWAYQHNMMENTMVLWVMLSIMGLKKALSAPQVQWFWLLASAVATWAAFMTKGPAGLFPLAGIFAYWLVWRSFSFQKMALLSMAYAGVVFGGLFILFIWPVSKDFMDNYFFYRTLQRINHIPVVASRFAILGDWLQQMAVPLVLSLAIVLPLKRKLGPMTFLYKKEFLFFVLIGALGTIPLMLTKVQRSFYLLTSFPFFALALSIVVLPYVKLAAEKLRHTTSLTLKRLALGILLSTLIATLWLAGKPKRDVDMLSDVHTIAAFLGDGVSIAASTRTNSEWSFKAYLMRKHSIQFVTIEKRSNAHYIVAMKNENFSRDGYCEVPLSTQRYALFTTCNGH